MHDLPLIATKNLIHKALGNGRSILEAKGHELPLVDATVGSEGRFGFWVLT